jgi:hypothetical protein
MLDEYENRLKIDVSIFPKHNKKEGIFIEVKKKINNL